MTALLIDTYSLFYRAFHALPPMNTAAGEPTHALYGLSVLLLKLLREEKPESLAFALDGPRATFRHEAFAAYKAGRADTPRDLLPQFARLDQLLEALAVPAHRVHGYEADDVLATLSRMEESRGVLVVSGDRDLLQLPRPGVEVLFVGARGKEPTRYDAAAVEARFGFPAARLPTYMALVGDSSDNLPKVPGIGERTAQKLVAAHADAEALFAALDAWPEARVKAALRAHEAQVRETERLARLCDQVPELSHPAVAPLAPEALPRLAELFLELEFKSLLPRVEKLREALHPGLTQGA